MNTLQSSLYAIAIAFCLLGATQLGSLAPRLRVRFFTLYLCLSAGGFLLEWLLLHPGISAKPFVLVLLMNVSLLVSPCLYLCVREVCDTQRPNWRAIPANHRWLLLLAALLTLTLLSVIFGVHVTATYSFVIHSTMLLCIVIFTVQLPYFCFESLSRIQKKRSTMQDLFSSIDDSVLNALRLLWLALAIKCLVILFRTLYCMRFGNESGWGLNLVYTLDITALLWVLYIIFRHNPNASSAQCFEKRYLANEPEQKYRNSGLSQEDSERIAVKLQKLMETDHAYKEASLSLSDLSTRLGERPHYLSQVINTQLGMSFYDWVNYHRVQAARTLLRNSTSTILEIAENTGFNSKSTFNTAFKKHCGLTPSQYRLQAQQESVTS